MAQRWDADRRQWVDDGDEGDGREDRDPASPADGGRGQGDGEQRNGAWWAAATQAGTVRPDLYPPPPAGTPEGPVGPPPSPQQSWPPQQQSPAWSPPVQPWPGGGAPPSDGGQGQGPGDSRRLLLVIVAVAVLAGGVGGGLWALTRDDAANRGTRGASAGPAVTVTATTGVPSDGPYNTGDEGAYADPASPTAPAPSPGYSRAVDPLGYTVDVPVGWARDQTQGKLAPVVTYTAPGGDRKLMVFPVKEVSVTDSSAQAQDIAEGFKGYRYLNRRSGADWAEFSYRYDSRQFGATETIDHRFQAADGTPYAIVASGPAGTDMSDRLTTAVDSFCPTGSVCGT
ncbi:hypothetical protein ACIRRT_26935 [Streptomyces sp. NPDC102256]|uniref:hypothetical protein n=1 Tax=Streptomyces sp. NPDC102256 TaxID=3366147 RepID=UPI00382CCA67